MSWQRLAETADPIADLWALAAEYRRFIRANRELAEVMFSRPFTDFSPGPDELAATSSVRVLIVGRVRRCIDLGRPARRRDRCRPCPGGAAFRAWLSPRRRVASGPPRSRSSAGGDWRSARPSTDSVPARRPRGGAVGRRGRRIDRAPSGEDGLVEGGGQARDEVDGLGVRADQGAPAVASHGGEDLVRRLLGAGDEGALEVPGPPSPGRRPRRGRSHPCGRCAQCSS